VKLKYDAMRRFQALTDKMPLRLKAKAGKLHFQVLAFQRLDA
jgi:hypothetical protein